MILEIVVTGIGVALSLPALIEDYIDSFEAGEWQTWMKMTPELFLTAAMILRLFRKTLIPGLVTAVIGLFCTYFCFLFNSRASASQVCDEFSDACADEVESSCSGVAIQPWEGLLYLLGLCLMTIGSTILIRNYVLIIKKNKVSPSDN